VVAPWRQAGPPDLALAADLAVAGEAAHAREAVGLATEGRPVLPSVRASRRRYSISCAPASPKPGGIDTGICASTRLARLMDQPAMARAAEHDDRAGDGARAAIRAGIAADHQAAAQELARAVAAPLSTRDAARCRAACRDAPRRRNRRRAALTQESAFHRPAGVKPGIALDDQRAAVHALADPVATRRRQTGPMSPGVPVIANSSARSSRRLPKAIGRRSISPRPPARCPGVTPA
jgi:hypothetical protein